MGAVDGPGKAASHQDVNGSTMGYTFNYWILSSSTGYILFPYFVKVKGRFQTVFPENIFDYVV